MAAKTVPFVASSPFGEKLLSGLQKVLSAAKAPVTLVQTEAKVAPAGATHLLAEPLCPKMTGELANKYGLSSRVILGSGAKLYPDSIYPNLNCEVVQNLYAKANPAYAASGSAPSSSKAVAVKDESAVKLQELQKDAERTITNFFRDEATKSAQATLRLACDKAIKAKADKKTVVVVTKPQGDIYDDLFAHVAKSESDGRADELRSGSVSVEVTPVGTAWPKLVVFPENVNLVVCAPNAVGDEVASLFVGIAGGTGMVAQQLVGSDATVYTCANADGNENPTGALLATCELLKALGHEAEANKVAAAVGKAYAEKILPKDLPGGKAEIDAFIESVAKHCA